MLILATEQYIINVGDLLVARKTAREHKNNSVTAQYAYTCTCSNLRAIEIKNIP